jgi:dTDP-4-dehydrorhamnose 3,5-epimerase
VIFTQTKLAGAYLVDAERRIDPRGFFARIWCREEFSAHGLDPNLVQCSISFNEVRGTLRGMHYQQKPHEEVKLVRCTTGEIYDVIVDLRANSPTRYQWTATILSAENRRSLYIPQGFAHGFQTLTDKVEVFYQMSEFYHPDSARGLPWNDPVIGIDWPIDNVIISDRDAAFAPLRELEQG